MPLWILKKLFSPRYLLLTNTGVCVCLLSTGDMLQQTLGKSLLARKHEKDYDPDRTSEFLTIDPARNKRVGMTGLVLGPMNHFWYKLLDGRFPGNTPRALLLKVFLDWASCPAFSSTYWMSINLQEGRTMKEAFHEYTSKFLNVATLDLCVWPPTQIINFWLLPPSLRVVYVATVQLIYNACISYIKHDYEIFVGS